MNDPHDPNKTLKESVSPIQFTGEPVIPLDKKLKKVLLYLAGAVVLTVIAVLVPILNLALLVTMPAAFGLAVYAVYLRYRVVIWEQNKAPDWSKIKVPPPKVEEEKPADPNATGVVFKE